MQELFPEEQVVNTLFGPGCSFKGDVKVQGLTRIDGDYIGTIESTGKILIGEQGRCDGTLSGRIVVVGGIVRGNIYATTKVIVLASSVIIGNIYSPRLIIEQKALVSGYLGITGDKLHPKRLRYNQPNKQSNQATDHKEKQKVAFSRFSIFGNSQKANQESL